LSTLGCQCLTLLFAANSVGVYHIITMRITIYIIFLSASLLSCRAFAQSPDVDQAKHINPVQQSSVVSTKFNWKDVFRLKHATDPQLSPDGKYLLYVRSVTDGLNDNSKTYIWLLNIKTGKQHQWREGEANSPHWIVGGNHIGYRAAGPEGHWKYYLGTIEEPGNSVVAIPDNAGAIRWSPDGKFIAFTKFVDGPAFTLGVNLPKPDCVHWSEPARVFAQKHFFSDGAGEMQPGYTHIFVMPVSGGTPKQVTTGSYNHTSGFDWTPDSKSIVFSSARGKNWELYFYNQDLYKVQVDNNALLRLTTFPHGVHKPAVSPDGKFIAFTGTLKNNKDYEKGDLYVTNADGSNLRSLSESLDREINSLKWAPDGKHIYADYDDHGITKLASFGLDGSIKVLADQLDDNDTFTFTKNGLMVLSLINDSRPADLFLRSANGKLNQLTHENDSLFNSVKTGTVKELAVTSSLDGAPVGSYITLPPDYDASKRYPLILSMHGGPHGSDGPRWSSEARLYAAAGYVVLKVNYRGSTSYGFAFADKTFSNFPGPAYDDVMSAVDAAIAKGIADPDRLFVTGGSAGGQLTAWIVGKTNRFKAAAAVKPVINDIANSLKSDQYIGVLHDFTKTMWEDPLIQWHVSALSLADKVVTPTLLLVGENDRRTPPDESIQFYHALQLLNIPTAIAIVPHATHETLNAKPSQLISDTYIILDWFGRYGGIPLKEIVGDK